MWCGGCDDCDGANGGCYDFGDGSENGDCYWYIDDDGVGEMSLEDGRGDYCVKGKEVASDY